MRYFVLIALLGATIFSGCSGNDSKTATSSENDVDAARNFIQSALEGNFNKARQFMLRDSLNDERMDQVERNYMQKMSREEKAGYQDATIRFFEPRKISDTETVINYANSFRNKQDSLKLTRISGQWLVDLKYSFLPPADSTRQ
jgi:PBP1b-binding outer membrane lipoprotein LpoB